MLFSIGIFRRPLVTHYLQQLRFMVFFNFYFLALYKFICLRHLVELKSSRPPTSSLRQTRVMYTAVRSSRLRSRLNCIVTNTSKLLIARIPET